MRILLLKMVSFAPREALSQVESFLDYMLQACIADEALFTMILVIKTGYPLLNARGHWLFISTIASILKDFWD